jgi:hypothetical protein
MLIRKKPEEPLTPLVQECCICGGQTTLWITGTAHIEVSGIEYRVYYHRTCLTDQTKEMVTEILNKKAGILKSKP